MVRAFYVAYLGTSPNSRKHGGVRKLKPMNAVELKSDRESHASQSEAWGTRHTDYAQSGLEMGTQCSLSKSPQWGRGRRTLYDLHQGCRVSARWIYGVTRRIVLGSVLLGCRSQCFAERQVEQSVQSLRFLFAIFRIRLYCQICDWRQVQ